MWKNITHGPKTSQREGNDEHVISEFWLIILSNCSDTMPLSTKFPKISI